MKHILLCIILNIVPVLVSAQSHVEPPLNQNTKMFGGNNSAGIFADKILFDGNRIVYANTFRMEAEKVDGGKTIYYVLTNPFVIRIGEEQFFGFSIKYPHHSAVTIPDSAQVLLKTKEDQIIKATALYGCIPESLNSTVVTPNFMGGAPITINNTRFMITAHIIVSESQYETIAQSELVKMRIETSGSSIDFDLKGKKFCKYMRSCLPILRDALENTNETSGFESGF